MLDVAVLYIATGRYIIFWETFFESFERYFLPNSKKHYFVFTDTNEILKGENTDKITKIYQQKLGWPYDTLMRFDIFLKAEKELEKMDYIFFFNANMQAVQPILESEFIPKEKGLVGAKHPGFYDKLRIQFPYDNNPNSLAYMKENEGNIYFMGGLNGGKSKEYLQLMHALNDRIKTDLGKDIIALWHDESHINRYFWEHFDEVFVLNEIYGKPEGDTKIKNPKIIIRNKSHYRYGGHQWLRGETNQKMTKSQWIVKNNINKIKLYIKYLINFFKIK